MTDPGLAIEDRTGWKRTALAALVLALGGLAATALSGAQIAEIEGIQRGQVSWLTLLGGGFISACIAWQTIVIRPWRISILRGVVAGMLAALLTYPITLVLAELLRTFFVGLTDLGERLLRALELTFLLLVTTGFAAMIVMGAIGIVLALFIRPRDASRSALEHRLARWLAMGAAALVVLMVGGFVLLTTIPLDRGGLDQPPTQQPRLSYDEAIARFAEVEAAEAALDLNPLCKSVLLTHGAPTAVTVIYLHGLTNCPAQADEFGRQLFAKGYNVYLPRFPLHGEADPLTLALKDLTAEDIVSTAQDATDIAGGLGERVVAVGLSGGGTATMWLAQNRADVDRTVAMAPFLSPYGMPPWANRAATNLLLLLPNMMIVWDPEQPKGPPGMEYAYPQVASRALGQFMRLGEVLAVSAAGTAPSGHAPGLLFNDADDAVDNPIAERVAKAWTRHGAVVDIKRLPTELGVLHDLMDPRQLRAQINLVYPIIFAMIEDRADEGRR